MATTDELFLDNIEQWVDENKTARLPAPSCDETLPLTHSPSQVTFKYLSHSLNVSSNVAKQMLFEFAQKHKGKAKKLAIIYFVSGWSAKAGRHVVSLVPADQVEDVKSKLEPLTSVHIYSIGTALPPDSAALWTVHNQFLTEREQSGDEQLFKDKINTYSAIRCAGATARDLAETKKIREGTMAALHRSASNIAPAAAVSVDEHTSSKRAPKAKGIANFFGKTGSTAGETKAAPEEKKEEKKVEKTKSAANFFGKSTSATSLATKSQPEVVENSPPASPTKSPKEKRPAKAKATKEEKPKAKPAKRAAKKAGKKAEASAEESTNLEDDILNELNAESDEKPKIASPKRSRLKAAVSASESKSKSISVDSDSVESDDSFEKPTKKTPPKKKKAGKSESSDKSGKSESSETPKKKKAAKKSAKKAPAKKAKDDSDAGSEADDDVMEVDEPVKPKAKGKKGAKDESEEPKAEKPAKKTRAKKAKKEPPEGGEGEEKPKKRGRKKKAEGEEGDKTEEDPDDIMAAKKSKKRKRKDEEPPEPSEAAKKFASHFTAQPATAATEPDVAANQSSTIERKPGVRYVKKLQKVTKKVIDADGFEVTQDVEEMVEVAVEEKPKEKDADENAMAEPPAKRKPPAERQLSAPGGVAKQANIMSFFGKK